MAECRKVWTPLISCVRHMAVGYHYKVSKKKCFYSPRSEDEKVNKIHIPFGEKEENMSRERKWQMNVVEGIFQNYDNIIAFHMKYIPRQSYE